MSRLSEQLPGTWELVSRIDVTASGERKPEASLGEDPVAYLIYDRSGHFAAQFMKRGDRSAMAPEGPSGGKNNSRAIGGYDAYFGLYTVDDERGTVRGRLEHRQLFGADDVDDHVLDAGQHLAVVERPVEALHHHALVSELGDLPLERRVVVADTPVLALEARDALTQPLDLEPALGELLP